MRVSFVFDATAVTLSSDKVGGLAGGRWDRARARAGAASFYLLALANVSVLFSIFLSQTLLGLGLLALLLGRQKLKAPLPMLPLALFAVWTLASLAMSPTPVSGLGQVKKFYIFLILVGAYSAFRSVVQVHRVFRVLFVAASTAAVLAIAEFSLYYHLYCQSLQSQRDFYILYTQSRITAFMSHWQTFSGVQMLVLALLVAFLLASKVRPWWTWAAAALISLSLLLAFTRGVWLGCLAALVYLLWDLRRRWLPAIPVVLVLFYLVSPPVLKLRVRSLFSPQSETSSRARVLMTRTGLNMIRQHLLFGVGPNRVQSSFDEYRPRPLGPTPAAYYGHLHSNYLQIAAERGLPCLAFFLWMLLAALRDQRRLTAHLDPQYRYIAHGIGAALVAVLVAGAFEYNFGDSEVAMLLLFYLSHGYTARYVLEQASEPSQPAELAMVGEG